MNEQLKQKVPLTREDMIVDGYVFDGKLQAWVLPNSPHNVQFRGYMPISERNGKAFIMPERE